MDSSHVWESEWSSSQRLNEALNYCASRHVDKSSSCRGGRFGWLRCPCGETTLFRCESCHVVLGVLGDGCEHGRELEVDMRRNVLHRVQPADELN